MLFNSLRKVLVLRQNFVPDDPAADKISGMVASSGAWSAISLGSITLLQFVRSMVFARLMQPADFGIISLANVAAQFILIFANFGFTSSIIYHRNLDKQDLATCWWGNLLVDTTAALICVFFAFATSGYQENPEMPWVMTMLAGQFILTGVGSVNLALLRRLFRFKQIAIINIFGAIAVFVTALFAVVILDWGVYGLVSGMVVGSAFMSLLSLMYFPWLPSFTFSRAHLIKHISYGKWLLGMTLANFTNTNADKAIVGTWLSATQLGYYEYASNLPSRIVVQLGQVINSILLPAYASLKEDQVRLHLMILRIMRFNSMITYPLLIGLAVVAGDFVIVAYGEKWLPVITPIRLLCISGILMTTWSGIFPLCQGVGKPQLPFKWSLIMMPLNIAIVYFAAREAGIVGVALARLFAPVFMILTLRREIMNLVELKLRHQLLAVSGSLAGSLVMAAVVYALQKGSAVVALPALSRLLLSVLVGGLVYSGFLLLFCREDLNTLIRVLKRGK